MVFKVDNESSGGPRPARPVVIAGLVAALVTLLLYLLTLNNGFVNWDDNLYVFENRILLSPSLWTIKWFFTAVVAYNWHPLTLLSFALDSVLWGLDAWGLHLTNALLHSANTFLVCSITAILARRASGEEAISKKTLITALLSALLFGLHPVHVESVAWISERKDVLYAFFFLLSILSYLKYSYVSAKGTARAYYLLSIVFFTLSLMSKPMAVSLPIVLLIIDYYPLKRLSLKGLAEKIPFFALAIGASIVTIFSQAEALTPNATYTLYTRILVAVRAGAFYLYKLIIPTRLAPMYPYPDDIGLLNPEVAISIAIVTAITAICLYMAKRRPLFITLWLFYLVTLAPVIGIVKVGEQAAADRYLYLPALAPFIIAALISGSLYAGAVKKARRGALFLIIIISASIIFALGAKSIAQINIWKNSETLWTHQKRLYPDHPLAYNNLGSLYFASGNMEEAIVRYREALKINPDYIKARNNLASALTRLGRFDEASREYALILGKDTTNTLVLINIGINHAEQGRFNKAIDYYKRAIELNPLDPYAYYNLAIAYTGLGDSREAKSAYQSAIELNPKDANAKNNLANLFFSENKIERAQALYLEAVKIDPKHAPALNNLGIIMDNKKRYDESLAYYKKSIEADPAYVSAHYNMAITLEDLGRYKEAIRNYKEVLRLDPEHAGARMNIEAILSKERKSEL